MERTLFWIGCGLGGYAFLLRQIFKRENLRHNPVLGGLLHLLFMTACGALLGFVVSASVELHGPTPKWPVGLALVGGLWGIFQLWRSRGASKGAAEWLSYDLEWSETSFSAILLAAVIMYTVVQAFKIPSGSMENTLHIGDHLFVNKFLYGIRIPFTDKRLFKIRDVRRGEIIVFECPPEALSDAERERNIRKDFIKRAVAIPGDTVEFRDKELFVNGEKQEESYAIRRDPMVYPVYPGVPKGEALQALWEQGGLTGYRNAVFRDNFGPVTVPPESYFVIGDNRDGSFDSRFWGPLSAQRLKGKAWVVYWPPKRLKVIR